MIEIICNESEKTGGSVVVKSPKNIRQIGNAGGRHKIYMEDYVYTFLHGMNMKESMQKHGAVLLGKSEVSQDIRYTFINGAIRCSDFIFQENGIQFDEKCWEYIYKEIKKYFEGEKVAGWFLGMNGFPLELTPMVEAAHRKYFSERDKVLLLSELTEKEDIFYTYEQGVLQRKEGYYIYYEKNPAMQEYMIWNRQQIHGKKGAGMETPEESSEEINPEHTDKKRKESANIAYTDRKHKNVSDIEHTDRKYKEGTITERSDRKHKEGTITERSDKKHKNMSDIEYTDRKHKEGTITERSDKKHKNVSDIEYTDRKHKESTITERSDKKHKNVSNIAYTNRKHKDNAIPEHLKKTSESYTEAEQALQNYRRMLLEKKEVSVQEKKNALLYITSSAAMIVLCIIGITTMNNYEKMKQVEETLMVISKNTVEETMTENKEVIVESIPGEVIPENLASTSRSDNKKENSEATSKDSEKETSREQDTEIKYNSSQSEKEQETMAQTFLEQGYYEVQPGDKLELICMKIYRTTAMIDKLCEINQIEDTDKIYAGQKLILP